MRSRIYIEDSIPNTDRKFGSALNYYVADFVEPENEPLLVGVTALLFTDADIHQAAERAAKNPEDVGLARRKAIERDRTERLQKLALLAAWTAVSFLTGANAALAFLAG